MSVIERIEDNDTVSAQWRPATARFWRKVSLLVRVALGCLATAWLLLGVRDVALTVRASHWPSTAGHIDWVGHARGGTIINTVGINPRPSRTSRVGTPEVQYRYVVDGDTLFGWRANITQPKPDGFRVRPRAWFDEGLPWSAMRPEPGAGDSRVRVYYDPGDPRQSALSVTSSIATWVELVAGVALLVVLLPRRKRRCIVPPG